jgi:hypothetical protein
MNCETETLLLREVAPRLRAAIPKTVPMVGPDDPQELLQDGLAIAVGLLQSAQRAGKKVSAGNLAYYTILALRSGRRSTGYRKNDVLHPAGQINGHSRVRSMDEPIHETEDGEELSLHDCLAAPVDDPATTAARRLDWASVIGSLDRTAKAILVALVEGRELTLLVARLKRSRSSLQTDKVRLGRSVREHLGQDILLQVQARPEWKNTLNALQDRFACRAERRAA